MYYKIIVTTHLSSLMVCVVLINLSTQVQNLYMRENEFEKKK